MILREANPVFAAALEWLFVQRMEVPVKARWIFLALLMASATASAQMYKWVDKDGKVRYTDTPPPGGTKSSKIAAPAPAASPAPGSPSPATKDLKDVKKGPLTPAEQEAEFRKRQADAAKNADKSAQEARAQSEKNEACQRSREYLATLESGQRIQRTNAAGERYYLEDAQVQAEITKARGQIQSACK